MDILIWSSFSPQGSVNVRKTHTPEVITFLFQRASLVCVLVKCRLTTLRIVRRRADFFWNVAAIPNNACWCFIHRAPPVALLLANLQMTHWFLQTKQIARRGSLQCDSEENSSLSTYIVVHEQAHFIFGVASVTVTCVKWAPGPASGARALAGAPTPARAQLFLPRLTARG